MSRKSQLCFQVSRPQEGHYDAYKANNHFLTFKYYHSNVKVCMREWPPVLTGWSNLLPPLQLPPVFLQISPEFLAYIFSYKLSISAWTFCKFLKLIYLLSIHNLFTLSVCSSSVNGAAIYSCQRAMFTSNYFLFHLHIQLATLNSTVYPSPLALL